MKPKICYIIDNLKVAGAEIHLFNLVKGLKKIGFDNLEVVSLSGEGQISEWITNLGIPVHNLRMKSIRRFVFLKDFFKLIGILVRCKPDIVHTYLDTANVFGVLAGKLAGIKTIMTSRRDLGVFRSKRMEKIIGTLSNRVDKVVCVCEAAAKESIRREGLHGRNIVVIHNGIEVEVYENVERIPAEHIVFCNVAVANRKEKGHEDLLRAFKIVENKVPDVRLKLVGDGPLLPGLKMLAHELEIAEKVVFAGQSNDIPDMLSDVSVFVLPSHSEGISNALLEAMAMGIPSVVTKVGGNPEVIDNSVSGYFVEPRNPESLAQGMLAIISDKGKMLEMGKEASKRVVDGFLFEKMVRNYNDLYALEN